MRCCVFTLLVIHQSETGIEPKSIAFVDFSYKLTFQYYTARFSSLLREFFNFVVIEF